MQPAQYSELRTITESAAAAIAADLESRDGQGKTQTFSIRAPLDPHVISPM